MNAFLYRVSRIAAAALLLTTVFRGVLAAPITYDVDRTVTHGAVVASVVGTITTDGALGTLMASDIVGSH